jgi:CheY-like chemotaxis protein
MINDILDLSLITNGKLRIQPTKFSVSSVVTEVSKLIKFQAKRKGVDLIFHNKFNEETNVTLFNDSNRLKQILLNLMSNALKFTEKGSITILIEPHEPIKNEDNKGELPLDYQGAVKFSVEDTGSGIKEQDMKKLFKLFGKIENSDSQRLNQAGIGLGLSISQNLTKFLNQQRIGEVIKASSVWQRGSCFSFSLFPFIQPPIEIDSKVVSLINLERNIDRDFEEGLTTPSPITRIISKLNRNMMPDEFFEKFPGDGNKEIRKEKHKILIVDDDQINIMVISKYMESFTDCEFETAFHGKQAVDIIKKKAERGYFFDVILMDCNMPFMDGFQATIIIQKMIKENIIKNVHIIASTANVSQDDLHHCQENGLADVLFKPYGKQALRAKLENYF